MNVVRATLGAIVVMTAMVLAVIQAGPASANTTIPFQVNPAPYGNPNGSIDSLPNRCVVVIGLQSGAVTVTGARPDRWNCYTGRAQIRWINLSTGATGLAVMSDGLNGIPYFAEFRPGRGQVALVLLPTPGITTPGFATFFVA